MAERLGLRVAELAPPVLRVKAALASRFDHGRPFDALEGLEPVLELVEVTERLVKQAPFGPLRGKLFEVRVSGEGPARYFEALVREATTAPEVALFFRPGEAAQARALEARGAIDEAARFDRYEFALLPEPEFATSVYRELTGAKVAPTVLHVRDGKLAQVSTVDLATVLAAIEALVELSAGRPGEGLSPLRPALVARARRPDPAPAPHVGRNDPCPCGSGKKFKQCHLGREAELSRGARAGAHPRVPRRERGGASSGGWPSRLRPRPRERPARRTPRPERARSSPRPCSPSRGRCSSGFRRSPRPGSRPRSSR